MTHTFRVITFSVLFGVLAPQQVYALHVPPHDDEVDNIIHVAYMENLAKYYVDENGQYTGFSYQIYNYVAEQMGYELDLMSRPTFRVVSDFYSGSSAFVMSPNFLVGEGNEGIVSSDEVMCISYSFFSKKGSEVTSVDDLAGKRVAFGLAGSFMEKYSALQGDAIEPMIPIKTLSATEALRMLAYDRVDATFLPTFFFQPILDADEAETGIPEHVKDSFAKPYVMERVNFRFHVHPNSPIFPRVDEFMSIVNQGAKDGVFLDILSEHEIDKEAFCNMLLD